MSSLSIHFAPSTRMASTPSSGVPHVCSRSVSSSAVAPVLVGQEPKIGTWGATVKAQTGNVLPEESTNDRQVVAPAAREHPDLDAVSGR